MRLSVWRCLVVCAVVGVTGAAIALPFTYWNPNSPAGFILGAAWAFMGMRATSGWVMRP